MARETLVGPEQTINKDRHRPEEFSREKLQFVYREQKTLSGA